jgi:hypothetical protein
VQPLSAIPVMCKACCCLMSIALCWSVQACTAVLYSCGRITALPRIITMQMQPLSGRSLSLFWIARLIMLLHQTLQEVRLICS